MCSVRHDAPCSRVLAVLDARSRRIRGFGGIDGPSQRAERVMLRKGFHGQAVGLILAAMKGVVGILGQQPCSRLIFARFCCRQEAPRNPDQQICSRHRSQVSTGQQRQFRGHRFCAESLPLVTVAPGLPVHLCINVRGASLITRCIVDFSSCATLHRLRTRKSSNAGPGASQTHLQKEQRLCCSRQQSKERGTHEISKIRRSRPRLQDKAWPGALPCTHLPEQAADGSTPPQSSRESSAAKPPNKFSSRAFHGP